MKDIIEILLVDDEPYNLLSFKATFRKEFKVHTASSGKEAYQQLAEHSGIQIIVVDQRMPDMLGTSLLEDLKVIYPSPIRILLTGFPDLKVVLESINKGNIFKFISKPWEEEDMRKILLEAYYEYKRNSTILVKYQHLQKAYTDLDRFASTISHDIKSPLSGIYSMVSLYEKITDKDEQVVIHNILKEATQTLNSYISHLKDYYETKNAGTSVDKVDIAAIIHQVYSIHLAEIHLANIQFTIDNTINTPIITDGHLLFIILNNLISNAIRFQNPENTEKKINISAVLRNNSLIICVKDNGIGIPIDQQSKIFDLFFRSSESKNGSGFGLYNAKQAADQLGGTLKLHQSSINGTIFILSAPLST